MKKILITGASGFIGSFLVEEALKQGFEVYAGIRETSDLRYLKDSRIKYFISDLADKYSIKHSLLEVGKFDYVIHNAGITKTCKKGDFEKVNYQYTKYLIEALYETNTIPQKFIQISSLAAYGPGDEKTLVIMPIVASIIVISLDTGMTINTVVTNVKITTININTIVACASSISIIDRNVAVDGKAACIIQDNNTAMDRLRTRTGHSSRRSGAIENIVVYKRTTSGTRVDDTIIITIIYSTILNYIATICTITNLDTTIWAIEDNTAINGIIIAVWIYTNTILLQIMHSTIQYGIAIRTIIGGIIIQAQSSLASPRAIA